MPRRTEQTAQEKLEKAALAKAAKAASAAVEFKDTYEGDEADLAVRDLVAKHLGTWKAGFDPKRSLQENLAKAAAVMPICAQRIGSHTPKLRNSRVNVGAIAPYIAKGSDGQDLPLSYMGGVDGKQNAGRMMLEPILFAGENRPKSLFERIRDGRGLDDPLVNGVLGEVDPALLGEIFQACRDDDRGVESTFSTENFAVIYIPDENMDDLLVTPLQAHSYFDTVENLLWREPQEGEGPEMMRPLRRSDVVHHVVVAKKDNIGTRRNTRARVNFYMPAVIDTERAEIFRFVKGGRFPQINDQRFDELMLHAAELFQRTQGPDGYSNYNIRKGLQSLVEMLHKIAQAHIDTRVALAQDEFDWPMDLARLPDVEDILTGYRPRRLFGANADAQKKAIMNFTSSEHLLRAIRKAV